ncbi:CAMK family protein kinase [Trichomonas vaginalis G3]|uniref:CAMK family protein kinase n=1 Tax=Trichomonas vaginalis (strain ATCC PRA-98 / G3) TaxID=412133 RepID=A2EKC0_TRIV3|nr:serine/threonine protein kinase ULK4 family [Trichomonas vaginalis G3]EAY06918.1 CAMK family protein kinase [Trichomonas vaginalis G3]KAI5513917.1 serine/threonine protein kinase ULK4 family [Trichomonas vaginalis G3]|eukprot:XP_001319141.1 CAMK family protein kinase [Trichomonas vaginalis G3]
MSEMQIKIYGEIGKGRPSPNFAQTVVYKARKNNTVEFVAAKTVDAVRLEEISNAVHIQHNLHHENIVQFYNWYQVENSIFLVLEYCPGGSLSDILERDVRLPESVIRIFASDVAAALLYLHKNGVYFTNFDTRNFILDENGIVKLSDFCRAVIDGNYCNLTDIDPEYLEVLPVEIIDFSSKPNIATDLYAFGCLLYKLACGQTPFAGEAQEELEYKIRNTSVEYIPYCSPELNDLIKRLTDKKAINRPTWSELIAHPFWKNIFASRDDYEDFSNFPTMDFSIPAYESSEITENEEDILDIEPKENLANSITFRASSVFSSISEKVDTIRNLLLRCNQLKQQSVVMNQAVEAINLPSVNASQMPVTLEAIKTGNQETIDTIVKQLSSKDVVKRQSPLITFLITGAKNPDVATGLSTNGFLSSILNLAVKSKHVSIAAAHCILFGTIIQSATKIDFENQVNNEIIYGALEKLSNSPKDKVKRKAISAISALLTFCANNGYQIPQKLIDAIFNSLKPSSDDVCRHYALKAVANVCLSLHPEILDLNLLENALTKLDVTAQPNNAMVESLSLAVCAFFKDRKPQSSSNEYLQRLTKTLIVKLGATTASLGMVIACECDILNSSKEELTIAFNKSVGEVKWRSMIALCLLYRNSMPNFMSISERVFSHADKLQYDEPQVYEAFIRWYCDYCDEILDASSKGQYLNLRIIVDSLKQKNNAMRIYRPKFDRKLRDILKNEQFILGGSELILEIFLQSFILGLSDSTTIVNDLLLNTLQSPIKDVRYDSLRILTMATSDLNVDSTETNVIFNQLSKHIEFLLNDDLVICECCFKVLDNLLLIDECQVVGLLSTKNTIIQSLFSKIGTINTSIKICEPLLSSISFENIISLNLIPQIMKSIDQSDFIKDSIDLLYTFLLIVEDYIEANKNNQKEIKKTIKSVNSLSTMAPKCASLVLKYPKSADCLKMLINIFTPLPGQTDVVIESAFQPFATALMNGHCKPECANSLKLVIEQLKKSAFNCNSMKLKLKCSSKLMSALRTAAQNGVGELRKTTEGALNVIRS